MECYKWVSAEAGETPAAIRQRVLAPCATECDGVILVDSDDIMQPERVAAARNGLKQYDLVACALRLVDQGGTDLGVTLGLPLQTSADTVLPRHNVFGLSNTAWRSDVLLRCLPVPADVELVDWFLATRAWLIGAKLYFDPVVGMDYRQHASNMVRVCPPFDRVQVLRDTERVRRHFRLVRDAPPDGTIDSRLEQIAQVADDVERFAEQVTASPERLDEYTDALNELDLAPLWWSSVAHPVLRNIWSD
jgi:hypothetical protein